MSKKQKGYYDLHIEFLFDCIENGWDITEITKVCAPLKRKVSRKLTKFVSTATREDILELRKMIEDLGDIVNTYKKYGMRQMVINGYEAKIEQFKFFNRVLALEPIKGNIPIDYSEAVLKKMLSLNVDVRKLKNYLPLLEAIEGMQKKKK